MTAQAADKLAHAVNRKHDPSSMTYSSDSVRSSDSRSTITSDTYKGAKSDNITIY